MSLKSAFPHRFVKSGVCPDFPVGEPTADSVGGDYGLRCSHPRLGRRAWSEVTIWWSLAGARCGRFTGLARLGLSGDEDQKSEH